MIRKVVAQLKEIISPGPTKKEWFRLEGSERKIREKVKERQLGMRLVRNNRQLLVATRKNEFLGY